MTMPLNGLNELDCLKIIAGQILNNGTGGSSSPLNWVNVTQAPYSATGDGLTDDTAAIQLAIATGHAVYFPNPSVAYKCGGLYPAKAGQQFICENPSFTKFAPNATGAHIWDLTLNVPTDPVSGIAGANGYVFDGFLVQGTWDGSTGSTGSAWFTDTGVFLGDNIIWRNCVVTGMHAGWNINGLGNCKWIACLATRNDYGLLSGVATELSMNAIGLQCPQNFIWNMWIKSGHNWQLMLADSNWGGATSAYDSAGGIRVGDAGAPSAAYVNLIGGNSEQQPHAGNVGLQIEGGSRVRQTSAFYTLSGSVTTPPVVVLASSYYDMRSVLAGSGACAIVAAQCVASGLITGDGAPFNYGTDDGGGAVTLASSNDQVCFDNGVPSPSYVGQGLCIVPRNGITSPNQVKFQKAIRTATAATISNASPAIVTMANTYAAGDAIQFTTTGTLPTGLSINTTYYVSSSSLSTSSFKVADTSANAIAGTNSINTTGAGSGTHTGYAYTFSDITNNLLLTGANTYTGNNTFSGTTTLTTLLTINGQIGATAATHIFYGTSTAGPTDLIEFHAPSGGRFGYIDDRNSGVLNMTGALQTGNAAILVGSTVTLTDGSGAQVGTITNAPKAGNPVKWVEISDNGTTLKIPAWSAS